MLQYYFRFIFIASLFYVNPVSFSQNDLIIKSANSSSNTNENLGRIPLTKENAQITQEQLWQNYQTKLRSSLKEAWDTKELKHGEYAMKFAYTIFGDEPADGRSLYISMHGGGGAPARVNDQQWKNQIGLYQPSEGVYLAPRAPTNEWNLWHLPHIDVLFDQLIQAAVLFENVNPNRVYLMGYSAGGDGVYQLAPRMADRWAAAAMMAGHPNDASPLGLRNIGFTLHIGADDAAYKRNEVAQEWKEKLAVLHKNALHKNALHKNDPSGYIHEVMIHEGKGHWMEREDAVAVEWMAQFTRDPLPKKIVWKQDDVHHKRFYWLAVDENNLTTGSEIHIQREGQIFQIEKAEGLDRITILMNDTMLDLDQPITVKMKDKILFEGTAYRTLNTIYQSIHERGDPELIFTSQILIDLQQ